MLDWNKTWDKTAITTFTSKLDQHDKKLKIITNPKHNIKRNQIKQTKTK